MKNKKIHIYPKNTEYDKIEKERTTYFIVIEERVVDHLLVNVEFCSVVFYCVTYRSGSAPLAPPLVLLDSD